MDTIHIPDLRANSVIFFEESQFSKVCQKILGVQKKTTPPNAFEETKKLMNMCFVTLLDLEQETNITTLKKLLSPTKMEILGM